MSRPQNVFLCPSIHSLLQASFGVSSHLYTYIFFLLHRLCVYSCCLKSNRYCVHLNFVVNIFRIEAVIWLLFPISCLEKSHVYSLNRGCFCKHFQMFFVSAVLLLIPPSCVPLTIPLILLPYEFLTPKFRILQTTFKISDWAYIQV